MASFPRLRPSSERPAGAGNFGVPAALLAFLCAALSTAIVLLVGAHAPSSTTQPQLAAWPASSSLVLPAGTTSLTVRFRSGTSPAAERRLLAGSGARVTGRVPKLGVAIVTVSTANAERLLHRLRHAVAVDTAAPDHVRAVAAAVSDPAFSDQWALQRIGWPRAFAQVKPKRTVTVAVLDTGVDGTIADLRNRLVRGWSAFGTSPATDPNGHGTWMASIAAASANNSDGIAGVAFAGTRVMPVQVLNKNGYGRDSDIVKGVLFAADHGARVILMSFAGQGYSPALQDAIDYAWSKGAVVVAATGNSRLTTPTYPAGNAKVVGVSATTQDDTLWSESNFGANTFIAAPGVDIVTDAVGHGTTSVTGTSASAALVAGSAAVLLAADEKASNSAVVGRLAKSAARAGHRSETGNGRLDLARALGLRAAPKVTPARPLWARPPRPRTRTRSRSPSRARYPSTRRCSSLQATTSTLRRISLRRTTSERRTPIRRTRTSTTTQCTSGSCAQTSPRR
jgi:thermitase